MEAGWGNLRLRMNAVVMTKMRLCAIQKMMKILKNRRIASISRFRKIAIDDELIADTANRLHFVFRRSNLAQLPSQATHMHIEAAIKRVERPAQHRLRKLFAIDHLTRGLHQCFEQSELDVSEVEPLAGLQCFACGGIELQIADAQYA